MGLSINAPGASISGLRRVAGAAQELSAVQKQLATLQRINSAADDAAGLAIAEGFQSQVRQYNAESASLQSGVNLIQVADAGLSAQGDAISQIRDLAVQASNGTLSAEQRQALNEQAQQLVQAVNEASQSTEFNGIRPLDGSAGNVTLDAAGNLGVQFQASDAGTLGVNGLDLSSQAGASNAISTLDNAASNITQSRAALGATQNKFDAAIEARDAAAENLQAAQSRISDLDLARATVEQTTAQILLQGSIASLAQTNVNRQLAAKLLGA